MEIEPEERNELRMALGQANPLPARSPAVVLAIPDLDAGETRDFDFAQRLPGVPSSRVGEDRRPTLLGGIGEQLVGFPRFTEEGEITPNRDVQVIRPIRVFDAGNQQCPLGAGFPAGLSIGIPAILVEAPIVLRHQNGARSRAA